MTKEQAGITSFKYGMLRLFMKKKMKLHTSRMKNWAKNLLIDSLWFFSKKCCFKKISFVHVFVSCFYFTRFFSFVFSPIVQGGENKKRKKKWEWFWWGKNMVDQFYITCISYNFGMHFFQHWLCMSIFVLEIFIYSCHNIATMMLSS